jgi:HAD superfamily hydrolase (TIGR01490 family)
MIEKKPIAVFDIDGTIFRSSLLIELNAKLVAKGIFPERAKAKVLKIREAWLNRRGSYAEYIQVIIDLYEKDIAGISLAAIQKISHELIADQRQRVYVYTRDLIKKLRTTHTLIIISLSPLEVVREFQKVYHFHYVSGTEYLRKGARFVGGVSPAAVFDKKKILQAMITDHNLSLRGSIGVGDTESDIAFLQMMDRPIAFNPNRLLYAEAKKRGWNIAVERKDVIYEL